MPNTTNFNFPTPADTDLVKDGASAIRSLGNSIDSAFVDLKGGTTGQVLAKNSNTDLDFTWTNGGDITEVVAGTGLSGGGTTGSVTLTNTVATAFDAAGDLVYGTGADTFTKLALGTAGQVLTVNSGATAPEWKTISSGGMTLLTSGTIASSPLNLTSISQDYKELVLYLYDYTSASTNSCLLRLNNSASGIYFGAGVSNGNGTINTTGSNASTSIDLNQNDYQANEGNNSAVLRFPNYTVPAWKVFYHLSMVTLNGGTTFGTLNSAGVFRTTTAISQINIINPTAGSYELYGVK